MIGFQGDFGDGHVITQEWEGIDDGSPFLTIRTTCACGGWSKERTYDTREYDFLDPFRDSTRDVEEFLEHLRGQE